MSKTIRVLSLALILAATSVVAIAEHHEPSIYVWINFMKAKPGQGEALTALLMEEDSKVLDPLVESGAALEWGIAMPLFHDGNDPATHVQWITFAGWKGVDEFMSGFMANRGSMSESDMEALDARWDAAVVEGSHSDMINRSVHLGSQTLSRPSYIHLSYWTAKQGKGKDVTSMFREIPAPIYDALVADGAILNYGLHVPAVHRGESWTHMGWFASTNLDARDTVEGAFDAMPEDEAMAMQKRAQETFEPGHRDEALMVVHHKASSGGE